MIQVSALLALLSDGRFRSGEELGRYFGVSRTAIWKALQRLPEMGIELQSVRGRGHRLVRPIELLDRERIEASLADSALRERATIELVDDIDSTNAYLMRRASRLPSGYACFAERQHGGKGRRGRAWVSPFGANVYLSLLWRFDGGAGQLAGLSLALAVAVMNAVRIGGGTGVGVKWPNDLLFEGRKLAGILVEVAGEADGACHVVAGVGLNVGMPATSDIDQPWADLVETGAQPGRNRAAGNLLSALLEAFAEYERRGLAGCLDDWRASDVLVGKPVRVQLPRGHVNGVACGVDENGLLLLDTREGLRRFAYGEVSVRAVEHMCC